MANYIKIGQINGVNEEAKKYLAEKLEDVGVLIMDDPEYPTICYAFEKLQK